MGQLSYQRASYLLEYNPTTGYLFWKISPTQSVKRGQRAGTLTKDGSRQIRVDCKVYLEHRLIWLLTHKRWPKNQIDHINGNPSDNRLCNLREATQSQNNANCRLKNNNKCKAKGVRKHWTGRYEAYITKNKKQIYLGGFSNIEDAHRAYFIAAQKYYGNYARRA